jgi:hypothetical protein
MATDERTERTVTQAADAVGSESRPAARAGAQAPPLELPDRRQLWAWAWASVRPYVGWALALLGAVALFLGWYGVSGQALTAKQLPYLVSGGLTGMALVILASVFLATDDVRRQLTRVGELERKIEELYGLLTTDLPTEVAAGPATTTTRATPAAGRVLALPAGTSYHRPDCALVAGKAAAAVDPAEVSRRGLRPCRVCDPAPPG